MSDRWIECQGHDGRTHKVPRMFPLYEGRCAPCALTSIRRTLEEEPATISASWVRALLRLYDQEVKDHHDEVNHISRQAAEDIQEAADRARWEAERNADRGSWW